MSKDNYFKIKGTQEKPIILSKKNRKYRVTYYDENDKLKSKDFDEKPNAEIFANDMKKTYK